MRLQRMLGHITTLVPKNPAQRAGDRLRRRRDGRRGVDRSAGRRTRRSPRSSRWCRRSCRRTSREHNFNVVRNPKVHVHLDDARHYLLTTEREVRRHHVRPARPVGEGRGDALHARVLRGREGAPQSGRRRDAVRAALREQRGGGEERDRDVPRGVPERRGVRQHASTARATTWCSSGSSKAAKIDVDAVQARLDDPANAPIAQSLREIGINSAVELFGTYAGSSRS